MLCYNRFGVHLATAIHICLPVFTSQFATRIFGEFTEDIKAAVVFLFPGRRSEGEQRDNAGFAVLTFGNQTVTSTRSRDIPDCSRIGRGGG